MRRADVRYLDVMERVLYNGFLSGVSLEGDSFFYTNPLESDGGHQRREYFDVACCPSNLARLMGQLPGFVYAHQGNRMYVNLFIGSGAEIGLPGGVTVVRGEGLRGGEAFELIAVPYFAWANRGPGEMAVWLPVAR